MSKISKIGYKRNRDGLETAYESMLFDNRNSEEEFYKIVIALAKSKISGRIFDLPEGCSNADDFAQEVVMKVWKMLPTHQGGVDTIYRHVNRIIFTTREDAFSQIKEETDSRVPLLVEKEDEEGSAYLEDNPEIHQRDYPVTHRRTLPKFIQGLDLEICQYIREGYDYAKIATVLSMTENAVKLRIAKMRNKIQEMKNAKS